jgi:hypothetical protein
MTDIVERLRAEDPQTGLRHSIASEAADEIERLREALADISNIINPYEDGDTMQEIARVALEGK